ncbi:hypothetical protein Zmor_028344 [Zophobas morio]|uniref:Uncharacterized protein n=1 Tax=Zophobas morio TaxID=2755281 RepID=A0AA38M3W1_9CUCU|nr:hypothetical protein Zmor_028344 [Zophobas morio]
MSARNNLCCSQVKQSLFRRKVAGVDMSVRHSIQPAIRSSIVLTTYPAIHAIAADSQFSGWHFLCKKGFIMCTINFLQINVNCRPTRENMF